MAYRAWFSTTSRRVFRFSIFRTGYPLFKEWEIAVLSSVRDPNTPELQKVCISYGTSCPSIWAKEETPFGENGVTEVEDRHLTNVARNNLKLCGLELCVADLSPLVRT